MTDMEIEMLEYLWEAWFQDFDITDDLYSIDTFHLFADLLTEYLYEEYELP